MDEPARLASDPSPRQHNGASHPRAQHPRPHAGRIDRIGPVGYLPQDPRTGDLDVIARDRVLSARGLDTLVRDIAKAQVALAEQPDDAALLRGYGQLEERFTALGGYAA